MEPPINKRDIAIPGELMPKWQSAVDTVAEVIDVPSALITSVEPPYIKVLCSSGSGNNPYQVGSKELLAEFYCGTVVAARRKLLVPNALKDKSWERNPAIKLGLISYLGFPLLWPDGDVFGTICVLDTRENRYGGSSEKLLSQFRELIEAHLALLYQSHKLRLIEESLGDVEEDFYPVAETTGDVIITADHLGVIIFWNRAAESLFGYRATEVVGRPLKLIMPERFHKVYDAELKQRVSTGESNLRRKVTQMVGVRKDGTEFPMELAHTPWRSKGGLFFTATIRVTTERKQLGEMLQRRNQELSTLNTIAQSISQSMKLDEILHHGLDSVVETMNLSAGGIYLVDEATRKPVLTIHRGFTEDLIKATRSIPLGVTGVHMAEATAGIINAADVRASPELAADGKIHYILTLPLRSRGRDLGMIALVTQNQSGFSNEHVQLFETISRQLGVAIDNAQLFEKTDKLSITDELTGLYNHRHFYDVLQAEIHRTSRYGGNLSLIMLDLDGFKQYNDQFGHLSGDAVLEAFGQTLKSALRKTDSAFRYGGDEFTIILPATDASRARTVVGHIQSKWRRATDEQQLTLQTTIDFSAGIAQFPENAETADVLILLADSALYHSKRAGRYQCTLASELGTISANPQSPATLERVYALLSMADVRNPHAHDHARSVAAISGIIGEALGLQPKVLAELNIAALLHDIGKVGIGKSILSKPDKLTRDEIILIRKHPAEGARIAGYVLGAAAAIPMVHHHHEWYDGTGYPEKLKSDEIPLGARIIGVADAYSTMTSEHADHSIISHEEALAELRRCSGTQFDPKLVQALGKALNKAVRKD